MKTKIYVCSNSGIDYIPHSPSISSIPAILHFSEEEQYEDYLDVNVDAFYNRFRMDINAKITPTFQNYSKILEYISLAKEEGYEQILFLLSSKEFGNLYVPISIAIAENKDIVCKIYNSNSCCYPLAFMAIEANNDFLNNKNMDEVISHLDTLRVHHEILFFIPKYKDEVNPNFKERYKTGKFLKLINGKVYPMQIRQKDAYASLIQTFANDVEENAIPFILYTDKSSRYIPFIEDSLIDVNPIFKKVKAYAIPPAVGIKIGAYAVGVGFVIKSGENQ